MRLIPSILTACIFCQLSFFALGQTQDVTTLCAEQQGKAVYYSDKFHGRATASGEPYDKSALMAAHRTLNFNSLVRVTNLENNRTVMVRITDRGPSSESSEKIIDLSRAAARRINIIKEGSGTVRIKVLRVGADGARCDDNTASTTEEDEAFGLSEDSDASSGSDTGTAGTDESFTPFEEDSGSAESPADGPLSERNYSVTDKALLYNIWGEQVTVEGYGVLIKEATDLEAAIDAGLEAYYKDFHQVFILADAPGENTRIFRVIVGQGKRSGAQKTGSELIKRGIRSASLVKHKDLSEG